MSIRKTEHVRSALGRLNTRGCKVGAIAILFVLMATATAAVFSMDYATATATTQKSDVQFVKGSDATGSTTYPAASVALSDTNDYATVGISMFKSVTQTHLQPATYYTDLLHVKNSGTVTHTIKAISISNVVVANGAFTNGGSITVYYCSSQTDVLADTVPHYTIDSSTTSGSTNYVIPIGSPQALAATGLAGDTGYIEIVAHASGTAGDTSSVTFDLSVQWA